MDHFVQRRVGIRAAVSANADKTLAAIKDSNSCFEDILKTAASEKGIDTLVNHILANEPEWAYQALRHLPDLGHHRDALIKKAADSPEWALHTLRSISDLGDDRDLLVERAGVLAQPIGDVSSFNLLDQGWYNCEFTMFWVNAGKIQPESAIPKSNWGEWKWSDKLHGGGGSVTMACSDFALPNAPLQPGNEVWIYMWVETGNDVETPFRFTYNPNTADVAFFTATGSTKSTRLSLTNVGPPNT